MCTQKYSIFYHYLVFLISVSLFILVAIKCFNTTFCDPNEKPITINVKVDSDVESFASYLRDFNKSYSGKKDYFKRFHNFKASLAQISRLNRESGFKTKYGLTKYSDMSIEEFDNTMLMAKHVIGSECKMRNKICKDKISNVQPDRRGCSTNPNKCDWRDAGVVEPVSNQKQCRSCWAFSIVGVMESMAAIQRLGYSRLSVQELTDCSSYTAKCSGGSIDNGLFFLCDSEFPITTENQYPLTLINETCFGRPTTGRKLAWMRIECNLGWEDIVDAIRRHGPVVAAVNAAPWQNYNGGVIWTNCNGNWDHLRHVVQIVGFDLEAETPHFIIKNSWGEDFGIDGYVLVSVEDFTCGIGRQIALFDVFD